MAKYLLDTNILLRLFDRGAAEHADCRNAVESLQAAGHALLLAPQVIYEFWVVSTRPAQERKGFGWPAERAQQAVDRLLATFDLCQDTAAVFDEWRALVYHHQIRGKRAHDARLIAFKLANDIPYFVTLNVRDFRGLTNDVLTPGELCKKP